MPPVGDSSVTQTWHVLGTVKKVVLEVLADSGDGSVADVALSKPIDGHLLHLLTVPDAVAPPDANYDITLEEANGFDVLQGVGANRSAVAAEDALIVFAATANHPAVCPSDALTLKIAGNTVVSAETTIVLYFSALGN